MADRTSRRFATPVEVLSVDPASGTADVIVVGWNIDTPVTVPLATLTEPTGMAAEALTGAWLEAEANCYAATADELVLSGVVAAPPLPARWTEAS